MAHAFECYVKVKISWASPKQSFSTNHIAIVEQSADCSCGYEIWKSDGQRKILVGDKSQRAANLHCARLLLSPAFRCKEGNTPEASTSFPLLLPRRQLLTRRRGLLVHVTQVILLPRRHLSFFCLWLVVLRGCLAVVECGCHFITSLEIFFTQEMNELLFIALRTVLLFEWSQQLVQLLFCLVDNFLALRLGMFFLAQPTFAIEISKSSTEQINFWAISTWQHVFNWNYDSKLTH